MEKATESNSRASLPGSSAGSGQTAVRYYLTFLTFLLPLKFGTVLDTAEMSFFPLTVWDVIFAAWPPFLFPVLAGIGLILAALLMPARGRPEVHWVIPGAWALLAVTALVGLVRTTELDFALLFLSHLTGAFCLAAAVACGIHADRKLAGYLITAIVLSTLLCCASAWRQTAFGGLAETAQLAEQMARERGQEISEDFRSRLEQRRAFGPFVYPNSLAAHLILVLPLTLLGLWQAGNKFEPVRLSRVLFVAVGLIAGLGALWFTGSRAAMAAFGGGLMAAAVIVPKLGHWRWFIVTLSATAVVAGLLVLSQGRSLSSLEARGDYYRAAMEMFASQPLTGIGLGEFYPNYMRLKPPGAEETRVPHNMLLNFAAQSGLAAAFAAVCVLCTPLFLLLMRLRQPCRISHALFYCVFTGLCAWGLHALADFNVLIPGTVGTAALLPVLAFAGRKADNRKAAQAVAEPAQLLRGALIGAALLATAAAWRVPGELHYARLYAAFARNNTSLPLFIKRTMQTARLLPFSSKPYVLLAEKAEAAENHGVAIKAYKAALNRAPHRSAFSMHIAENCLAVDDFECAAAALRHACFWYPHNPRLVMLDELLRRKTGR